jgi:hypothetical protein
MLSQDKSESHSPHPTEWRRLQRRLRIWYSTCGGACGPARMEWHATTVPAEEVILGWRLIYIPLDRDSFKLPIPVTRPFPRGPAVIGLGPDWSGGEGRQTSRLDWIEGADILSLRRTGPTRAMGQQGVVGKTESADDRGHASDGDKGAFPVTA